MSNLIAREYKRFEDIKSIREDGSEFWSARKLASALEYTKWENFSKVIKRAMIACENAGHKVSDDFPEVRKIVDAGATTKPVLDYELSRYACYLIVQNGDPRKEVIALGQTYFAKAIIFDFDYTLGDSTNGIALSINYALEQLGYPTKSMDDIKMTIGLSLKETYKTLASNDNLEEADRFAQLFKEKADDVMVANTELYVGVKEVLQQLKNKGYRIGIVTTKFHYRIEQILSKFEANELVDIIVGAEDVKIEKPNPEGLLWAIEHLGIEKENVLYVGDSLVDVKTAQNASVDFVAVLTGTTTREEFDEYSNIYIGENVVNSINYLIHNN